MFYRLIVIENSLLDKTILKKYPILSETWFDEKDPERRSKMYKVRVPENEVIELANSLKNILQYPYYLHFYHEDPADKTLVVVFHGTRINTNKKDMTDAVHYGITHGVSEAEMQIAPTDINNETW